jgi:hypothetical protein
MISGAGESRKPEHLAGTKEILRLKIEVMIQIGRIFSKLISF